MSSFFCFSLALPLGVFVGHAIEDRQWFRNSSSHSIGEYMRYRIRGYALLSWFGIACFLLLLGTRSEGMDVVDPRKTHNDDNNNKIWMGALLGTLSGLTLGCGLTGSILNYNNIRASDTRIENDQLSLQLLAAQDEV